MKDAEQWKGRKYKMEHQVKEVKIVQHCIQLTIAKNENISKTAVTFLVFDNMFVNSCCTT